MLEGETINIRVMEKEDIPSILEWVNDPEYWGDFQPFERKSKSELERQFDKRPPEQNWLFIEKKNGSKIGVISHFPVGKNLGIGFNLILSERGKGFGTEAVKIMVDYLFLSKQIVRIQAHTDVRNVASQKVLEKAGFKREGTVRKFLFVRGKWRDMFLSGILREEWKEPKILKCGPK